MPLGLAALLTTACASAKVAPATTRAPVEPATPVAPVAAAVPEPSGQATDDPHPSEAREAPASIEVVTAAPTDPLQPEQHEIFFASAEDEPAELRGGLTQELENKHYLAGNEKSLAAFYPVIKDIGGGYVGVGSDQAYLLTGWAKPKLAWFIDYDANVVAIHKVYRAFFLAVDTPAEFMALWDKEGRPQARRIIDEAYDGQEATDLRSLYGRHRGWIDRRLEGLARRLDDARVPSFLTDRDQYAYVQAMLRSGRIRPMLTNLLERHGVTGIGEAARKLGVPIRVLYLSNAEQYWNSYSQRYRENIASLPFDDRSMVLRTLLVWHVNQDYRYNVQPADNYLEWLERDFIRNVNDIVHSGPPAQRGVINFFETNGDPTDSAAHRRAQKRAAQAQRSR